MGHTEPLRSLFTLNWGVFGTLAVLKLLLMIVCDVFLMKCMSVVVGLIIRSKIKSLTALESEYNKSSEEDN